MSLVQYWVNGDGVTTTWALPGVPFGPLQVFYNGALIPPTEYENPPGSAEVTTAFVAGDTEQIGFVFETKPEEPQPPEPPIPLPPVGPGPGILGWLSEVANDPDLARPFLIQRSTGQWVTGVWQSETKTINAFGVISVAEARDLEMVPEADKVHGAMVFWSAQPIYGTHGVLGYGQGNYDGPPGAGGVGPGSSDILVWGGLNWRVLAVKQYVDYGYFRAVATRMRAE